MQFKSVKQQFNLLHHLLFSDKIKAVQKEKSETKSVK